MFSNLKFEKYKPLIQSPNERVKLKDLHFGAENKKAHISASFFIFYLVARGGIEPPTQGFSILCSTD